MKKFRQYVVSLLVLVLLVGCGSDKKPQNDQQTPESGNATKTSDAGTETAEGATATDGDMSNLPEIEFTMFFPTVDYRLPPDDAPVLQQLFEKTKVRIKRILPPSDPIERLNIMLATDDLPDLISFRSENVNERGLMDVTMMNQYINAGKILKLNELLEKNAPNVLNINFADFAERLKDKDGNMYYLPTEYSIGEPAWIEANSGFNMRTGYLEEKDWYTPKTLDDYYNLLLEIKKETPDRWPVALALGPMGHLDDILNVGGSAYGLMYNQKLILENDQLYYFSQHPKMKEYFQFLNRLSQEQLMDPESAVMSAEMLRTKAVANNIFSFIGRGWQINSEVIAYEADKGSTEQSKDFYLVSEENVRPTYSRYAKDLYTTGIALTTKNKDPERFMQFYEYLNTEEGWFISNGIVNWDFHGENTVEETEGYHFVVFPDIETLPGRMLVQDSAWKGEMWGLDENWYIGQGLEQLQDLSYFSCNYPNGKYDMLGYMDVGMWWDENTTRVNEGFGWTGTNYGEKHKAMSIDTSSFTELYIDPNSEETTIMLNIDEYIKTQLPKIILAKDNAEFEKQWSEMETTLNADGLPRLMGTLQKKYEERKEAWN